MSNTRDKGPSAQTPTAPPTSGTGTASAETQDARACAIAALGQFAAAPFTENAQVYATIYIGDQLARIAGALGDSLGDDSHLDKLVRATRDVAAMGAR